MTTTPTNTELYARDFYTWGLTTAALIRAQQWKGIDLEALAEEIEGLARKDRRDVKSRLTELVLHLLKWHYQPIKRQEGHSWLDSVRNQRTELVLLLEDNHTLRTQLPSMVTEVYSAARRRAIEQMEDRGPLRPHEITRHPVPLTCPWTPEQLLEDDFWPEPAA
jgi:Domain of unknown function DUF29